MIEGAARSIVPVQMRVTTLWIEPIPLPATKNIEGSCPGSMAAADRANEIPGRLLGRRETSVAPKLEGERGSVGNRDGEKDAQDSDNHHQLDQVETPRAKPQDTPVPIRFAERSRHAPQRLSPGRTPCQCLSGCHRHFTGSPDRFLRRRIATV